MDSVTYPAWVQTDSERKLHDDFRYFLWFLWRHLGLPTPTRRQLAIARYLQHGPDKRMIQAWRGASKSWITCAYVLWRLYRDPQERVKIISANEDKALENATFIKRLIDEVPELNFLRSREGQRDSALKFDVGPANANPAPSVAALGIFGQLTGGRATVLIADDIEVPKNSFTETMRERLAKLVTEFHALVVPEGYDIIYLGTPQTEQTLYTVVRQRGFDCRIWPVRYPKGDELVKYGSALADDIVEDLANNPALAGTTVEPTRFTDSHLIETEMGMGRSEFTLHFMLDTSASDAMKHPLKLSDLIVMSLAPDMAPVRVEWCRDPRNVLKDFENVGFAGDRYHSPFHVSQERAPWQGTVMIIDPSGKGSDETAYSVVSHLNGMLGLRASGGFTDGYGMDTLEALANIAKANGVNHIKVESNYGDGMFTALFQPVLDRIYPCVVEEYKVGQVQKEKRIIDDLEPVLNQHRLMVDPSVIEDDLKVAEPRYSLFYQLTHLSKTKGCLRNEDRLEALSVACKHFREVLAQDTAKALDAHKAKLREEQLEAFMKRAGQSIRPQTIHGMPQGVTLSSPFGVHQRTR